MDKIEDLNGIFSAYWILVQNVRAKLYSNVYKLDQMPRKAPNFDKLVYFSEEEAYIINRLIDSLTPTNNLKKGLKEKLAAIYDSTDIENYVDVHSNAAHVQALEEAATTNSLKSSASGLWRFWMRIGRRKRVIAGLEWTRSI